MYDSFHKNVPASNGIGMEGNRNSTSGIGRERERCATFKMGGNGNGNEPMEMGGTGNTKSHSRPSLPSTFGFGRSDPSGIFVMSYVLTP